MDHLNTAQTCSWLNNCNQLLVLNGSMSTWREACNGDPQGSVLDPVVFNIFMNNIDEEMLIKFVDDTQQWEWIVNIHKPSSRFKTILIDFGLFSITYCSMIRHVRFYIQAGEKQVHRQKIGGISLSIRTCKMYLGILVNHSLSVRKPFILHQLNETYLLCPH